MAETKFEEIQTKLQAINVSQYVEKKESGKDKNGKPVYLSYLSWSYAWGELIKVYPTASYEIERFGEERLPFLRTGEGYMVFTKVTIEGHTREMWLSVIDSRNNAMKEEPYTYKTKFGENSVDACDMNDINKTIMRCLVKNISMFGLGLNIYQGDDMPNIDDAPIVAKKEKVFCEECGNEIVAHGNYSAEKIIAGSQKTYGKTLCFDCSMKAKGNKSDNAQNNKGE